MKSCPTCNRTFEDTFTFCLADGSLLIAPFDPQATLVIPESRQTEPTEELQLEEETETQQTIISPRPEQRPEGSVSTIAATAPVFEPSKIEASPAQPGRKSQRLSLMIGALTTLLIIGLVVFILVNRTDSAHEKSRNENAAIVNTATPDSANSTSSAASDLEPNSTNTSHITTESAGGKPLPSPSRSPTKQAPRVASPSANSGKKDIPDVAKPARPDANASTNPCANKAYPVCEPGEKRVCNEATGVWYCRRSRK